MYYVRCSFYNGNDQKNVFGSYLWDYLKIVYLFGSYLYGEPSTMRKNE